MKKFNLLQILITIVAVVLTSIVVVYAYTWTAPLGPPPSNDVPPPVNVGGDSQTKVGNFGIGIDPNSSKGREGYLTAKDVFISNIAPSGKWVSELTGGGAAPGGLRQGVPGCNNIITTKLTCNTLGCEVCRGGGCISQYLTCGGVCGGGTAPPNSNCPTFPIGATYCISRYNSNDVVGVGGIVPEPWSPCNIPPPPDCSGAPYYGCFAGGWVTGAQTRQNYACQSDGTTWLPTGTPESRTCQDWGRVCQDSSYCSGGG